MTNTAVEVTGRRDTPEGPISAVAAATTMSFVPSAATDLQSLRAIPGVTSVRSADGRAWVEGVEDVVLAALSAQQVTPHRLRVLTASLDTAWLDLTASTIEEPA